MSPPRPRAASSRLLSFLLLSQRKLEPCSLQPPPLLLQGGSPRSLAQRCSHLLVSIYRSDWKPFSVPFLSAAARRHQAPAGGVGGSALQPPLPLLGPKKGPKKSCPHRPAAGPRLPLQPQHGGESQSAQIYLQKNSNYNIIQETFYTRNIRMVYYRKVKKNIFFYLFLFFNKTPICLRLLLYKVAEHAHLYRVFFLFNITFC